MACLRCRATIQNRGKLDVGIHQRTARKSTDPQISEISRVQLHLTCLVFKSAECTGLYRVIGGGGGSCGAPTPRAPTWRVSERNTDINEQRRRGT